MDNTYDSPFWKFVRETAARADAMPHWKWGPREGCECEWCEPKQADQVEGLSRHPVGGLRHGTPVVPT